MSKKISHLLPAKTDALSRITSFMSNEESGVILTAGEEKILSRLVFAHGLLAEKKLTRDQIALKIKELYGVSIHTARNDIDNTYGLFVRITEDYKRYTLFHHIEFIERLILQWSNDKSLAPHLPKLIAERTRAIAAMPVESRSPDVQAPVVIVQTTVNINSPMNAEDALSAADKLIEFEKTHEYTEFQDVKEDDD